MLMTETNRIAAYFDDKGKLINPVLYSAPPPTSSI
jgi:hypothetical protein